MERKEALEKLKLGEINVIFSVDMFNEGLDVPEVDLVMFLRPREFLQHINRKRLFSLNVVLQNIS